MKIIYIKNKNDFGRFSKLNKNISFFLLEHSKTIKLLILLFLFFDELKSYSLDNEKILESNEYNSFNELKRKTNEKFSRNILKEISIIKNLFSSKIESYKSLKNIIHITSSINNDQNYKYILLVSMHSLLTNCNKNKNFIIYHILCTPDFNESSTIIFKSLLNKFSHNIQIIFYNMGNNFSNCKNKRFSEAAYYRLLTPVIINSDRIIHLDGDTLVFSDLEEMFNLNFNDNYILGIYDYLSGGVDYLGIKSNIYINSGVILLNLKKIREDKKTIEFVNLTKSNIKIYDQTVINFVLYPKIGRLPSKYAIFNFEDTADIKLYVNCLRTKINLKEIEDALKKPVIIHNVLCYPKLWFFNSVYQKYFTKCEQRKNCSCKKYYDIWHSFAKKTDYYKEIANFTGVII